MRKKFEKDLEESLKNFSLCSNVFFGTSLFFWSFFRGTHSSDLTKWGGSPLCCSQITTYGKPLEFWKFASGGVFFSWLVGCDAPPLGMGVPCVDFANHHHFETRVPQSVSHLHHDFLGCFLSNCGGYIFRVFFRVFPPGDVVLRWFFDWLAKWQKR